MARTASATLAGVRPPARTTGRVEQDSLDPRIEVGLPTGHQLGGLQLDVASGFGRQAQALPGRSVEPADQVQAFLAGQLDHVGIEAADDLGQALEAGVGGDRHHPRPVGGRRAAAGQPGQRDCLLDGQAAGRAGDQVEPDRVGPGGERRHDAGGVGDPADLDQRRPVRGSEVGGQPPGGNEAGCRRGR
ncbi:MAG TPA: hypothetical protein VII59_01545, partial [Streptosporangiaceae bacterium]